MAVNRVRVVWTGTPTAGGGLSTFYFNSAVGTPAQHVSAVATFLDDTEAQRVDTLTWATEQDVATLNVGTGALEAVTSTTVESGTGSAVVDNLPAAVQGLLRMTTNVIAGPRLLRGRLFLPGADENANSAGGIPLLAYRSDYEAAAAVLIGNANADWSIWSQTHGVLANVASASVWTQWASLRSRRD